MWASVSGLRLGQTMKLLESADSRNDRKGKPRVAGELNLPARC